MFVLILYLYERILMAKNFLYHKMRVEIICFFAEEKQIEAV